MGIFIHFINIENKSEGNIHQHMNESRLARVAIRFDTNHPHLVVISCTLVAVAIKILYLFCYLKLCFEVKRCDKCYEKFYGADEIESGKNICLMSLFCKIIALPL